MTQAPSWRNMCIEMKESVALLHHVLHALLAADAASNARYKLLTCRCTQCKTAAPYAACPWRGKVLVCLDRMVVSLFEAGMQVTSAKPPRTPNLTAPQKELARQMAQAGMKPARIRTAMLQQLSLQPS
ncbi:hypothetical protein PHYSODRAFT_342277 [Phytophthora sojae]|uniref:Uncharacterized protein n=1 Tax=Phytophthora sojae (strain P6497) TaxID=1094619 RepID=G5AFS4_PHYSP|nr:hypothetical protein PHYSODRAFT_342277 [Phytophthora sojae]EGZ05440.1 hypothetical protein PHYSODRAFT_342277 [Phytophthora sojae]|eukprot:XP_009538971.1 hypothetical protein PHYSODRAFT_342277 [Phytophthora sojae]